MKAVVFNGVGNITLSSVKDPEIKESHDAIVKLTLSAICGTDLHSIRGTLPGMKKGTVLGHEGVGVVEQVGKGVHKFRVGDRVIVPSTIGCGSCHYCKQETYAQCDKANPNGPDAGTAYYGGPATAGPFDGMQAEKVRVPFADTNLVHIPESISDEQAILLSDILPTACMAVELAQIAPEDTVAVFGCGPVGQLVIACLKKIGIKKVFAIDCIPSRLKMAESQGAHVLNFNEITLESELKKLTNDKGPNKIIDAVGVDAIHPEEGIFSFFKHMAQRKKFKEEVKKVAPKTNPDGKNWVPGNGPSQVLRWAVETVAKNGTISIIGVYPDEMDIFLIGKAMGKNLTIAMGDCNHRKYIPMLIEWVKGGFPIERFITQKVPLAEAINAYKHFDKRENGWIKVVLTV